MHASTRVSGSAWALGCGALGGLLLAAAPPASLMASVLMAPLAACAALRSRYRPVCIGLLLGVLCGSGAARPARPPDMALPAVHTVVGTVKTRGRRSLVLELEGIGDRQPRAPLRVRIQTPAYWWYRRGARLLPGTRIELVCRLAAWPAGHAGRYWRARGVSLQGRAVRRPPRILQAPHPLSVWIARQRRTARDRIEAQLERRDAGLVLALVTGEREALDRRDRALVVQAGQAHLLAVSGLHVGLMLLGLTALLTVLGLGPRRRAAISLVAILLYVPFTGGNPATVRAGLGTGLYLLGRALGRQPDARRLLACVFIASLWLRPQALLGVGMQLSFAAVAGILLCTGPILATLYPPHPHLPGRPRRKTPRIVQALAVSLAAWLVTAPIVADRIGRLSPGSPFVSVLAVPLVTVIVLLGLLLGLLPESGPVDGFLTAFLALFVELLREVLAWPDALALSARPAGAGRGWAGFALLPALVLCAMHPRSRQEGLVGLRLWRRRGLLVLWFLGTLAWLDQPSDRAIADRTPYNPALEIAATLATPAPLALAGYGVLLVAFAGLARWRTWLTTPGAIGAWVFGALSVAAFGLGGLVAGMVAFLLPTLLGRLPGARAHAARGLAQVAANGAVPACGALLALLGLEGFGLSIFCGGLAFLASDSCATEIGIRYGGRPCSLIPGRRLEAGESGGVSGAGTLAAAVGGLMPPLALCLVAEAPLVWAGWWALAGFVGALLDSVLGATLQFRGRNAAGTIVEARTQGGAPVTHVRGLRWLDNDAVNGVASLAAALLAWLLWRYATGQG